MTNHVRVKLGTKLQAGFALVVVLATMTAAAGLLGMRELSKAGERMYSNELLGVSYLKQASVSMAGAARARAQYSAARSEEDRAAARQNFDKSAAELDRWLDKARSTLASDAARAAHGKALELEMAWRDITDAYFAAASEAAGSAEDDPRRKELSLASLQASHSFENQIAALTRVKEEHAQKAAEEGALLYRRLSILMLVLTAFSAAVGAGVGALTTRSVMRQLGGEPRDVAALASAVAAGDLRTEIDARGAAPGSVVAAMSAMQQGLREVVSSVRSASESVATASTQIAQGNTDLSQRTEQQAASLEETAASMEQLNVTVQNNTENAKQARRIAADASEVAVKGGETMARVVDTMKGISESSRRIEAVVGVIDDIAFQTNLLALNAAVEAARAGQQGRGFAVVAAEVRRLAQRSAESAKEVKRLIADSVQRVESGSALVDRAGATMQEIVSSVRRVDDLMGEIAAASVEQSQGVGQVGEAVSQLDQVTQQNAALVEQSMAASHSLMQQAQALVQAAAVFKLPESKAAARTTPQEEGAAGAKAASSGNGAAPARVAAAAGSRLRALKQGQGPVARDGGESWASF